MNIRTMQVRKHTGGLTESIATMKTIPATMAALKEYLTDRVASYSTTPTQEELDSIKVKLYDVREEKRIPGWNGPTYLVTYNYAGSEQVPFAMCSAMPDVVSPVTHLTVDASTDNHSPAAAVHAAFKAVLSHDGFYKWCTTNPNAVKDLLSLIEFNEIESGLTLARLCFTGAISGMDSEQLAQFIQHQRDRGIEMEDIMRSPVDVPGKHYVQIKLANGTGNLFVYNSDAMIGR